MPESLPVGDREFPGLAVVVPVRNECGLVPALIDALRPLEAAGARVVIVDHASGDGTGDALERSGFEVVTCPDGGGLGRAVKRGLHEVHSTETGYVAWLPGNLKVEPLAALAIARELHRRQRFGTAFVKARRLGRRPADAVPSLLAGVLLSVAGRGPYWEVGGTPTIIPATEVTALLDGPDGLQFETATIRILRGRGLRMLRLPVAFGERPSGRSHWNTGVGARFRLLAALLREVTSRP